MQRAAAVDAVADLKEDIVESKKQLRTNMMESVSLKTQIANLEDKVRLLESDPQRPHTPRSSLNLNDPFGNAKIIRELEKKLEDTDMTASKLERERIKNEKRIKLLTEDLAAQTSLAQIKNQELNIVMQENGTLQKELSAQKGRIEELRKRLEGECKKNVELEKQLRDLTSSKEDAEQEKNKLQLKAEELNNQLALETEQV